MEIKKFIDSMLNALGNMDLTTIEPMNQYIFHPLFAKEWIARIQKIIDVVEERHISLDKVAETIKGSSHLRAQLYFLLLDLKSSRTEKEQRAVKRNVLRLRKFLH